MTLVHISRKSQKVVDHAFSTYCLALNIGAVMALSEVELQTLGLAALLHESGWVQLPLNLMGKRSRYTPNELKLVQQHVALGERLLTKSQLPSLVCRLINEHHERGDGSGYPNGLALEKVHSLSRVLAIADAYDERIYQLADKPGVMPRNAVREIYLEAEKGLFDPALAKVLVSVLGVYPTTSAVLLNTDEKAIVLENNPHSVHPKLQIWYNGKGVALKEPEYVDLEVDNSRTIVGLLNPADNRDDPYGLLVVQDA